MDQKNLNYRNQIQTSKQRSYTKGRKVPTVIVKVLEGKRNSNNHIKIKENLTTFSQQNATHPW